MRNKRARNVVVALVACAAAMALAIPAFSHGVKEHGSKAAKIGDVESFADGVLAVKVNSGAVVTGAYTGKSKTLCFKAKGTATTTTTTTTPTTTTASLRLKGEDDGHKGGDKPKTQGLEKPKGEGFEGSHKVVKRGRCKSSNLQPGVDVIGAKLVLTDTGLRWESVAIVVPAAS
jgi:hypothetical protein